MLSQIAGGILFLIGVAMYVVSLWGRIKKLTEKKKLEGIGDIKDTVEALAKLAESFSKFSEDIQFLLLGTGCLLAGIYLLQTKPF